MAFQSRFDKPPVGSSPLQRDLSSNADRTAQELRSVVPDATPKFRSRFTRAETDPAVQARDFNRPGPYTTPDSAGWVERYLTAPFGRGVDRAQALGSLAIGDVDEFVEQQREILSGTQLTAEDQAIMEQISTTDSALEALKLYATNPRLMANITAESLGLFLPTLLAGAGTAAFSGGAALPVAAATIGAGSFGTEYLATIEGELAERGVDLLDANQVNAALSDEQFMASAREKAVKRGIPIAIFDALSVGLAGKLVGRVGKGIGRKVLGEAGEIGLQAGLGASGEAGGQLASEGRITSPGEIVSEGVGEILPGIGEQAISTLARRRNQPPPPPPTQPPPETTGGPTPPRQLGLFDSEQEVPQDIADEIAAAEEARRPTEPGTQGELFPDIERPVERRAQPEQQEVPEEQLDLFDRPPEQQAFDFERDTTDEDTAAEIEQALEELGPAYEEPEYATGDDARAIIGWMQEQRKTKEGRERGRELFREKTGTKKSPAAYIKDRLQEIADVAAEYKFIRRDSLPAFSTRLKDDKTADFYESLVNELYKSVPEVADAVRRAVANTDPVHTANVLEGVVAILQGAKDVHPRLLGTDVEPVISQYRRGRLEADNLYSGPLTKNGKPKKARTVSDAATAVYNMIRATERLLRQRAVDNINVTPQEWEQIVRRMDKGDKIDTLPDNLQKKINSLGKTFSEGFETLREAKRLYASGSDVTAQASLRAYQNVSALGKKLERISKKRQARDQKLMEKTLSSNTFAAKQTRSEKIKQQTRTKNQLKSELASLVNRYATAQDSERRAVARRIGQFFSRNKVTRETAEKFLRDVAGSRKQFRAIREALIEAEEKSLARQRETEEIADMSVVATASTGQAMTIEEGPTAVESGQARAQTEYLDPGQNAARNRQQIISNREQQAGSSIRKEDLEPSKGRQIKESTLKRKQAAERKAQAAVEKRTQERLLAEKKRQEGRARPKHETVSATAERKTTTFKERRAKNVQNMLRNLGITTDRFPLGSYLDFLFESTPQLAREQRLYRTERSEVAGPSGRKFILPRTVAQSQALLADTTTGTLAKQFFSTLNQKNSLSAVAAGFRMSLKAADRRTFDGLVDEFVAAPQSSAYQSMVALSEFVDSKSPEVQGSAGQTAQARMQPAKEAVTAYAYALRQVVQAAARRGELITLDEVRKPSALENNYMRALFAEAPTIVEFFGQQEHGDTTSLREVLIQWRNSLPRKSWMRPLITKLIDTGVDIPVVFREDIPALGRHGMFSDGSRRIEIKPDVYQGAQMYTLLHEAVHAVTVANYHTDAKVKQFVDDLYNRAVEAASARGVDYYGLKNSREFIAEGFSNPEFQQFLKSVEMQSKSLWQRFVNFVRQMIGLAAHRTNALATLMEAQDILFQDEAGIQRSVAQIAAAHAAGRAVASDDLQLNLKDIQQKADAKRQSIALASKAHLGFMNLDFMERKYRSMLDRIASESKVVDTNPFTMIRDAVTRVTASAQKLSKQMLALADRTQALEDNVKTQLYQAMIDATMAGVHVDQSLTSTVNEHLFDKKGNLKDKAAVTKALASYRTLKEMSPEAAELFAEYRDLLTESFNARRAALLKHALETTVRDELTDEQIKQISELAGSDAFDAYLAREKPDMKDEMSDLVRQVFNQTKIEGPYFPLRREGEFIVVVEDDDPSKQYFSMHRTRAEAEAEAAGIEGAVVRPFIRGIDTPGINEAMRAIASKVGKVTQDTEANDIKQQVNNAVTRILADHILYGSQLKRKGVAGVKVEDMPKSIEDYVRSSITAVSSLDAAHDFDVGLRDLGNLQRDDMLRGDEQDLIARIRNELLLRAKEVASDRNVTPVDRILGSIGFFTYLGAPSYWMLNATQTAAVGVPVLAGMGNVGYLQASQAMKRAYGTLRRATKGMGWRALDDLDAVLAKLEPDQAQLIQRLADDNVIQATIAHEFGLLTRSENGIYNKVVNVLQKVPEMIERWNRMSMALAAIDVGVTDYVTVRDIVEGSQFNYDPANRARLLKYAPEFFGGGARRFVSPVMMFKVFGVQMAEMVYGNMVDGFFKRTNTPAERAQARKILYGILGTHTAFGGVFGGLGLGIGQVVLATVNQLWDDEDKLEPGQWLDAFLTEHTSEYAARIVTRGLPAAVGADFSASVNLGNLIFMSRDTDWTEYGGVEQSVYGLLGPVAQYFGGGLREAARLVDGEASVADFAEKAVPLKLFRALMQSYRYTTEGLETRQGQTFLDPGEVDLGTAAITALGLRPAEVSQRQAKFYSDRSYNRTLESRKSELMANFIRANTLEERRLAREEISEWNKKMRERRNVSLIIGPRSLQNSANARQRTQQQYSRGEFTDYRR